jgi:hypothetical protein
MTDTQQKPPVFLSREEEAQYWDTHSLATEWKAGTPAHVIQGKRYTEGITVRFPREDIVQLRATAKQTGIATGSLIRMWVKERLQKSSKEA